MSILCHTAETENTEELYDEREEKKDNYILSAVCADYEHIYIIYIGACFLHYSMNL